MTSGHLSANRTQEQLEHSPVQDLTTHESKSFWHRLTGQKHLFKNATAVLDNTDDPEAKRVKGIIKRMRIQIWAGAGCGFLIAACIGAAFIAVVSVHLSKKYLHSSLDSQHLLCQTNPVPHRWKGFLGRF